MLSEKVEWKLVFSNKTRTFNSYLFLSISWICFYFPFFKQKRSIQLCGLTPSLIIFSKNLTYNDQSFRIESRNDRWNFKLIYSIGEDISGFHHHIIISYNMMMKTVFCFGSMHIRGFLLQKIKVQKNSSNIKVYKLVSVSMISLLHI